MFKREGFPDEGDFIIGTIKSVGSHGAQIDLDEYQNKQGILHSSEIGRKYMRRMRINIKPGRKFVCKVMAVRKQTNEIMLSLRRVGAGQDRSKQADWKNEKRADDLLKYLSKSTKIKIETLYKKTATPILKKYDLVYPFFVEAARDKKLLDNIGLDAKLKKNLYALLQQRIKIPKAVIRGTLILRSSAPDGVEQIKKAVAEAAKLAEKKNATLSVRYTGAPRYRLVFEHEDPKEGEKILEQALMSLCKQIRKSGDYEFKRA